VDIAISKLILQVLQQHQPLRLLQQIKLYEDLNNLIYNKETQIKVVGKYFKENKFKFQSQKTGVGIE
jgi:hypothetical protein